MNDIPDLEPHVLRFADLGPKESPYRPVDTLLPRFRRKRYSVVGRPAEQVGERTPLEDVDAFNLTYLACEPGTGIGAHAHDTEELFIVMAGRWRVTLGENAEQATEIGPFDLVAVPPGIMHGAMNISDETGWMMTVNAGHGGARIAWAANLVAELRAAGHDVADAETPGSPAG